MTRPGPNTAFPSAVILASAGQNRTIDAEWVLVGWRENGRCRMLASEAVDHATLTFARIRQQFEFRDAASMRALGIKAARTLNADITSYVLIEADSYAECLAALLFGYQWRPDKIRMIRNPEAMGRNSGPSAQTEPAPPCGARAFPGSVLRCQAPAGHYPGSDHAHTVTWHDEPDPGEQQPALEGSGPS